MASALLELAGYAAEPNGARETERHDEAEPHLAESIRRREVALNELSHI